MTTKLKPRKRVAVYPYDQPRIPYVLHIDGFPLDQQGTYVLCTGERISPINNDWSEYYYPDEEPIFLWHADNDTEINCPDCLKHPFYTEFCIELDGSDNVDEEAVFNKTAKRFFLSITKD